MLIPVKVLEKIRSGDIDLAFRRWQKPTVKVGGRLRSVVGELRIGSVNIVDPSVISDSDATRAGYASADDLRADLFRERPGAARTRTARPTGSSLIFRVEVAYMGQDTRVALRNEPVSDADLAVLLGRIDRMDTRTTRGMWVQRTLGLIESWPGRRAPELAEMEGLETLTFNTGVRKLKELGLTESLRVGYRLSPRGERVLRALRKS